jgi:replicative DNA helicase
MNAPATIVAAPANLDLEEMVLGGLLLNNSLMGAVPFLAASHFSEPVHRTIFQAIAERVAAGRPASAVMLARELPPIDDSAVTMPSYLAHLVAEATMFGEQLVPAAREVVRWAARRRLAAAAAHLADGVTVPGASPEDVAATAEMELIEISDDLARLAEAAEGGPDDFLAEIGERMESGRHVKGVESGLVAVDRKLGGFAPGEFIVVAGRPGMGKTMLGLSLARRAANVGAGVGFVSLEMTRSAVWHRLLADEALSSEPIAYKAIARGRLGAGQYDAVRRANERLKALPLLIRDTGNRLSDMPAHVRACRKWLNRMGKPLDILIVDYLGLLAASDRYAGQKVNEVGEISATLKALAKREGLCIVALHQLNRANEARGEYRPRLSDLRDSGNLEQDADVVMFVYRESYYIERPGYRTFADEDAKVTAESDARHRLELIVAKQRQGEIGTCRLWCDVATNSVRDEAFP